MTLPHLVADYLRYRRALGRRLIADGLILRSFCHHRGKCTAKHMTATSVLTFLRRGGVSSETVARRRRALAGFYRYVQARYGALLPALPDVAAGPSSSFVPVFFKPPQRRAGTPWH